MANVTDYTYKLIRDLLESKITHIELRNEGAAKILRIPVTDPRVTHVYDRTKQEQTYIVVLKGTDIDVPVPSTFAGSALFDSALSEDALSAESMTPFTIYAAVDQLTVTHRLQIPAIDP